MQPTPHRFSLAIPWFGQVQPTQAVTIAARSAGTITTLEANDGAMVHKDDLLFTLGGREIASRRRDLNIQLHSAQQRLKLAQKNLKIRQAMVNERLSSNELFNGARQTVAQATTRLSAVTQALALFDAAIRIRAPINGVFTERTVNIGQYVVSGAILAKVINPNHVRIEASIFPPSGIVLQGLPITIRGAANEKERHGTVQQRFPEANAAGAVRIWIIGDELAGLRPGTRISGQLAGASHRALAIPSAAIARDEQGSAFVFVQTKQGLRKRAIQTGLVDHSWVEVTSGLTRSERVVATGAYELLYGDFSRIYQAPD
ncbi:MAG: efflux RND transporter periplasmic adaptor subunit [Mariprofundales bacterium]|nr:efflux RND transporter periplasmic adaptor subunit [Mariprofundales bacterium]